VRGALAAGDAIANVVNTTGLLVSTVNRILGADRGLQTQRTATTLDSAISKKTVDIGGKCHRSRFMERGKRKDSIWSRIV